MEMHLPELDFQPTRSSAKDRHHYPHAPMWTGTQNWDRLLFLSPHFTGRDCHLNIIDRLSLWTYFSCMNNVEVILLIISLQVSWGSLAVHIINLQHLSKHADLRYCLFPSFIWRERQKQQTVCEVMIQNLLAPVEIWTAGQKTCIRAETIAVELCSSATWDCQDLAPGKALQLGQPKAYDSLPLWMAATACCQLRGWHSCPGNKLWVIHHVLAACLKFWCSLVYGTPLANHRAVIRGGDTAVLCMNSNSGVSRQLIRQGRA